MQNSFNSHASFNTNKKAEEKFNQLMEKICKTSTYQYFLIVLASINYMFLMLNYMTGSFVFMNPIFQCNGVSETEEQACQHIDECIILNNYTAVFKNKLYCDKQPIRTTIQTVFAFNYLVGKISYPLISDLIGRRKLLGIIYAIGILGMATLLISIQYNIQTTMVIGELLAGLFGSGISTITFIYICDLCNRRTREISFTYCWSTWGIAEMLMYLFYNYLPEWNRFTLTALLGPISLVFILFLYMSTQSPVYAIFVKNDIKLFTKILKDLQFYNKISQQDYKQIRNQANQIINLLTKQKKNTLHLKEALIKIFCNKQILKTVICLILMIMGYIIYYFGVQGSMQTYGLNFGVNMLFSGIVQFVAQFSTGFIARFMPRKFGTIFFTVFSSILGILFIFQFVQEHQILQTSLIVITRFTSCIISTFVQLIQSQLFDAQIRSTCISIVEGSSQISRLIIPYMIQVLYNLKIHPIIVFGIIFILMGAVPVLFLKQTKVKSISKNNQKNQTNEYFNQPLSSQEQ